MARRRIGSIHWTSAGPVAIFWVMPQVRRLAVFIVLSLPLLPCSPGRAGTSPTRPGREVKDSRKARAPKGVYHRLEPGQTLAILARAYQVPVDTLMRVNGITDPTTIPAHTKIFIPGARRIRDLPSGETPLAWPLRGRITTPFNLGAQQRRHHEGIDIDGEMGEPIRAAEEGEVIEARKDGKYGNSVRIAHGDGLTTFYAHASRLMVQEGDWVRRGEVVAEVGRSGNARGTHLHFEVRRDGRPVNPLPLLRDVELAAGR